MDERTILIGSFGAGVLAQVLLLLNRNIKFMQLLFCAGVALFAMLPGKHENNYDPLFHALMAFSGFCFLVALTFHKEILPTLSEAMLLLYTVLFWFVFFSHYYHGSLLHKVSMGIAVIPTVITLYLVIDGRNSGSFLKLMMYVWFLVIVVCLGVFQFPLSDLSIFYREHQVPWITPLEAATSGAAYMFLVANATYIFNLVPIPDRSQSWRERMEEWRKFTGVLVERFSDTQISPLRALTIVVVEASILALNENYQWLSTGLVINLVIVFSGSILQMSFISERQRTSQKLKHWRPR